MAEFAQKQANSAITTFALGAKLCKVHICNIFAQGIFYENLIFRAVGEILMSLTKMRAKSVGTTNTICSNQGSPAISSLAFYSMVVSNKFVEF